MGNWLQLGCWVVVAGRDAREDLGGYGEMRRRALQLPALGEVSGLLNHSGADSLIVSMFLHQIFSPGRATGTLACYRDLSPSKCLGYRWGGEGGRTGPSNDRLPGVGQKQGWLVSIDADRLPRSTGHQTTLQGHLTGAPCRAPCWLTHRTNHLALG